MIREEIESILLPGDCLLYSPKGLAGFIIRTKTWNDIAHCELYIGKGKSAASRDGLGVAVYPWRDAELAYVLRPVYPLDWAAFWKWFKTVDGQGYDWVGLLRFAWFKSIGTGKNQKQFCSEFLARAFRELGAKVFRDDVDADGVAPFEFLRSPNLTVIATQNSLRD